MSSTKEAVSAQAPEIKDTVLAAPKKKQPYPFYLGGTSYTLNFSSELTKHTRCRRDYRSIYHAVSLSKPARFETLGF